MSKKKFRSSYDGERYRVAFKTSGVARTKNSFIDDADINNIMKKFENTGQLPDMIKENPQYGDFSNATSYHESIEIVQMANEQFNALNAHIRARFKNDPEEFLAFAEDPKNAAEMIKMGLATERKVEAPKGTGDPTSPHKKKPVAAKEVEKD